MENLIANNAKFNEWPANFNFENCLLNRGEYGQFLADYIRGERRGFVLNLNGSWGSGKTEFLKRFYSLLLSQKHPVIYIDAWESDFSKDPLTVAASELLTQLECFNKKLGSVDKVEKVKEVLGNFIRGTLVGAAAIVAKHAIDDAGTGVAIMQQLFTQRPEDFLNKLSAEHQAQVSAINEIRIALGELAQVLEDCYGAVLPVVVLVDELDRCRPNYAIEMLEVIKHFFKTDNFVFVVATDTDQLVHSVSAVYGANFDAGQYLKRFFDRKVILPSPDLASYIAVKEKRDVDVYSRLTIFPIRPYQELIDMKINIIAVLAGYYDLKIRDIDQLLYKLDSCLRTMQATGERQGKDQLICFPALVIGLIEFDKGLDSFKLRSQTKPDDISLYRKTEDEIFGGMTMTDFVHHCMMSTQVKSTTKTGSFDRRYTTVEIQGFSDLSDMINDREYTKRSNWANEMSANLSLFDHAADATQKYWLWDNYKKVIELAGNIE
ncbi:hypothetical protein HGO26_05715 [Shewanella sp. S-1]|uniref:KAP NTPase domain-containing protein n=1 Tax=Shewanella oncorhynchi TaxID=2726434 RepID=A0ABX1KJK6_9GAMM|nr:P-loop NTPase fold protein [Shewanella oncorhynchi]NLQ22375.1 hypothetical protein [Shewanella oncorhynchi]